jgi:hypothetical protein
MIYYNNAITSEVLIILHEFEYSKFLLVTPL